MLLQYKTNAFILQLHCYYRAKTMLLRNKNSPHSYRYITTRKRKVVCVYAIYLVNEQESTAIKR